LPLPSRRLTTLVSYEFHQRDSTLPAFDYQDHRVSLRWTVSFEKEKGLPRTVTPPGHIVSKMKRRPRTPLSASKSCFNRTKPCNEAPHAWIDAGILLPLRSLARDRLGSLLGLPREFLFRPGRQHLATRWNPPLSNPPHEILVPCPETLGNAEAFDPQDPRVHSDRALWVDARSEGDYAAWHPSHARSIPYDFLLPTDASVIKALAASGAAHVVVYGDGANPDSGEQLAMELSGRGIKNVGYLRGGASALRAALKVGQP
jgi:rhodanese-related sulfurtransferase